jgi:hypothetical protein
MESIVSLMRKHGISKIEVTDRGYSLEWANSVGFSLAQSNMTAGELRKNTATASPESVFRIEDDGPAQCPCGHNAATEHNDAGECYHCTEPGACVPPLKP